MALALTRKDNLVRDTSLDHVLTELELPLDHQRLHDLVSDEYVELLLPAVVDEVVNYRILLGFNTPSEGILHQVSQLLRGVTSVQFLETHAGELF